jgi:hypothetical protein
MRGQSFAQAGRCPIHKRLGWLGPFYGGAQHVASLLKGMRLMRTRLAAKQMARYDGL